MSGYNVISSLNEEINQSGMGIFQPNDALLAVRFMLFNLEYKDRETIIVEVEFVDS
jgi:hypothetical protein